MNRGKRTGKDIERENNKAVKKKAVLSKSKKPPHAHVDEDVPEGQPAVDDVADDDGWIRTLPASFDSASVVRAHKGAIRVEATVGDLVARFCGAMGHFFASLSNADKRKSVKKWLDLLIVRAETEAIKTKIAVIDFAADLRSVGSRLVDRCDAFFRTELALERSESESESSLSSSRLPSLRPIARHLYIQSVDSFASLCDDFVDIGDQDDEWLLSVMHEWWETVKCGRNFVPITAALVKQVFRGESTVDVKDLQSVMCNLMAHYFAAVAARARAPWLRFFVERSAPGMPDETVKHVCHSGRHVDAAAFASTTAVDTVDDVARASILMSFEFKRNEATSCAQISEAARHTLQDTANVIVDAKPGEMTPCLFSFAGTATEFNLMWFRHDFSNRYLDIRRLSIAAIRPSATLRAKPWLDAFCNIGDAISLLKPIHRVMQHILQAYDLSAGAGPAMWRVPRPLMVKSSFTLPEPIAVNRAALSSTFTLFAAMEFPLPTNCTIVFKSVLAATSRRVVCRVELGNENDARQLVLKFATCETSATVERESVERVVELFARDELRDFRDRVRLPIGYIGTRYQVLVSELWPGRSLAVGRLDDKGARAKVCHLLQSQIFPVIRRLREADFFYMDLHAGNVMVNEDLTESWLIDFESAIHRPADNAQLSTESDTQMDNLLELFK